MRTETPVQTRHGWARRWWEWWRIGATRRAALRLLADRQSRTLDAICRVTGLPRARVERELARMCVRDELRRVDNPQSNGGGGFPTWEITDDGLAAICPRGARR